METHGKASDSWQIETRIAATPNDLQMVMAIRAATFLAEEEHLTYADEFNGNDFVATHFLVLVNGDPAGAIRIRWFQEFAVLEKVCVRSRYRSYRVFRALGDAAMKHLRRKGWRVAVGRARGDTHKLWSRLFGARPTGGPLQHRLGPVIPLIFEFSPVQGCDFSNMAFGQPDVEELVGQVEGQWDFSKMRIATYNAAE